MGDPNGQDQWQGCQPISLARWQLLDPRRRCGAGGYCANGLQVVAQRSSTGTPSGERSALASYSASRPDQRLISASTTHQTISIGGIMKYSARQKLSPTRQRTNS